MSRCHRPESVENLVSLCDQPGWTGERLVRDILAGNIAEVRARAESAGHDPNLASTVLRLALFPILSHVSAIVEPWMSRVSWPHGTCPTCGSWPLMAEFRGLEQVRYLCCGLCSTSWEFPRLACPFCGERDHKALGFFHVDGEEAKYRVTTCDACQGYVKTVSTLAALRGPQLLVMDLTTLHLDLAAVERETSRGVQS